MVFNATFNNITVISWGSVLLVEATGENHRPVPLEIRIEFDILNNFIINNGGNLHLPTVELYQVLCFKIIFSMLY